MVMFRWICSATVLLLGAIACLMASLHHSGTPRLRKLQSEPEVFTSDATNAQAAQAPCKNGTKSSAGGQLNGSLAQAAETDVKAVVDAANLPPIQQPGSVLIVDDHPVLQARCNTFKCPLNSSLREMPETIPCMLAEYCTGADLKTCCKGDWPNPEHIPRTPSTFAPTTIPQVSPTTTPEVSPTTIPQMYAPTAIAGIYAPTTTPAPTTAGPKKYLPVFLMHGLGTGTEVFAYLTTLIEQEHPGTIVHAIPLFTGKESFKALQTQVETISGYIRAVVMQDPATYSQGYNMVCYSQGGLICRGIIEFMDDHNVNTFVSLAAPHLGVYGPEFFKSVIKQPFWQKWTLKNVWRVAQSWILQATLSLANMWHDPFHPSADIKHFLPKYNNLANDPWGNARRKANFVRLKKAVFLSGSMAGSHWDGGIEPTGTGVFEYYKEGSITEFVPMKEQPVYREDTFGLRTLEEQGKLEIHNPPGVYHGDWVGRPDIVLQYVLPHLQ
mmetsp:Transcript_83080/g.144286  ORF Transcript_83080/g.144286 Transcript_83080/m.144286 type:complete len:496 (-) Transcript_83080:212-1699(-)